jgi:2-iminobutanoate/2-iminopropanoate deaminase
MMKHQIIHTDNAPQALGPYSQAVVHNGMLYCSGQIGIDPSTGNLAGETIGQQAEQVMKNLEAVLSAAGSTLSNVLKCTIFLADMDDFSEVNEIYGRRFPSNPPARETVAVRTLPKHCLVEISCVAYI